MNREEFINDLKNRLKRLPKQDIENAISYYAEYLEDANLSNDEDVTALFGNPAAIASEILADYAINQPKTTSTHFKSIWFVILAILAAPIGLPLAFTLIILLLVPVIIIGAFSFAFAFASLTLIGTGMFIILLALFVLTQSIPTTIFFIGAGLLTIGLGLLFGLLVFYLTRLAIIKTAKLSKFLLNRKNQRGLKTHEQY